MPEITVWPVSSSVRMWKVGSSSPRRREGDAHLLLVGLGLRLDRDVHHRVGEGDRLEDDRRVGRAQRVAGGGLLEAHARGDVAGVDRLLLLAVVGVHHQDAPDALGALGAGVEDAPAGVQRAGVDAEVGELADERVGHDLEGQRGERRVVVGRAGGRGGLAVAALLRGLEALHRRHVERAGQVVDDRVEQRLHALVLEGGAAHAPGRSRCRAWPCGCPRAGGPARSASPRGSPPSARRRSRRAPRSGAVRASWAASAMSAGISSSPHSWPRSSW